MIYSKGKKIKANHLEPLQRFSAFHLVWFCLFVPCASFTVSKDLWIFAAFHLAHHLKVFTSSAVPEKCPDCQCLCKEKINGNGVAETSEIVI